MREHRTDIGFEGGTYPRDIWVGRDIHVARNLVVVGSVVVTDVSSATSATIGNLNLTGNTISAVDANGSIFLSPNGTGAISLSGNLLFSPSATYDIGGNPPDIYTGGADRPRNGNFSGNLNIGSPGVLTTTIQSPFSSRIFIGAYGGGGIRAYGAGYGAQDLQIESAGGYFFTSTGSLKLGGITAFFPAIKRNGTGIDFRLGDDSAYTSIAALNGIFNGNVGIGISPSSARLDLLATGDETSPIIRMRQSNASSYGIDFGIDNNDHGGLYIRTRNDSVYADAVVIRRDNGNVGIGKNPSYKLDVDGTINIPTTTSISGSIFQNSIRLIHSYGTENFFAGATAGNFTLTGVQNLGVGYHALGTLSSGLYNAAFGYESIGAGNPTDNAAFGRFTLYQATGTSNTGVGNTALYSNTSGTHNVGIGKDAGRDNTTGYSNTFIGSQSGYGGTTSNLVNASAFGFAAQVTQSNSLILGGTGGNAVYVGIGTTAPASKVTVVGGDVEVTDSGDGLILKSPDGTRYRITVANGGTVSVAAA